MEKSKEAVGMVVKQGLNKTKLEREESSGIHQPSKGQLEIPHQRAEEMTAVRTKPNISPNTASLS